MFQEARCADRAAYEASHPWYTRRARALMAAFERHKPTRWGGATKVEYILPKTLQENQKRHWHTAPHGSCSPGARGGSHHHRARPHGRRHDHHCDPLNAARRVLRQPHCPHLKPPKRRAREQYILKETTHPTRTNTNNRNILAGSRVDGSGRPRARSSVSGNNPPPDVFRSFRHFELGQLAHPLCAWPATMLFHMCQLEVHCRQLWTRRLARPGAVRRDMFLWDYFPPAGPRLRPLRPFKLLLRRQVQPDR